MQNSGRNVVFFGTEDFSLAALQALVEHGYGVALVVTKPDSAKGRGMILSEPAVKTYAVEHAIPVVQPQRLNDIIETIAVIPDRIGVLSSYGKIIPQSILDLFTTGIVNIHPSLLPRYRGPSPIETAIMNGDAQTGVSLMRLVAAMDAGPVYQQTTVQLDSTIGARELYATLAQTGATMLVDALPAIADESLSAQEQNENDATYTRLLSKKDAQIDPATRTADEIIRHIRAYELYPRTRLVIAGHDIIVLAATTADNGALTVTCIDSTLSITDLIAPSGKRMSGAEFTRGYLK